MRESINTKSESRDNGDAGSGQFSRKFFGYLFSIGRIITGTDHGNKRGVVPIFPVAAHIEKGWGILDFLKEGGKIFIRKRKYLDTSFLKFDYFFFNMDGLSFSVEAGRVEATRDMVPFGLRSKPGFFGAPKISHGFTKSFWTAAWNQV